MIKKQKLELTWIGKEDKPNLEPRILIEDPELSYHAKVRYSDDDLFDNKLILGDNLLALKALEQEYAGKIKCVFIDPPYNTGSAFEHYDDGIEHSLWLSLMRDRLQIIKNLISDDGTLWITIDDNECHYLKVLCDEIFGRNNFIAAIPWQKIHSVKNDARIISVNHDTVLFYGKDINKVKLNLLPRSEAMDARFANPDNDPRGPWSSGDLVANEARTNGNYIVTGPTGKEFTVPATKHWVYSQANMNQLIAENQIWFGTNGTAFPRKKRFLKDVQQGRTPDTWWVSADVGHNQEAKREVKNFNPEEVFSTPKPERFIQRVLHLATNPGELVLDSFAGSGTTGAVAQKMKRRWIMVELGEHCRTHIIPRLKKVIDGEDQGGISESLNWKGGGGFRYYKLAPSLLEKDKWGQWIINKEYDPNMLAAAICKHEGFTYQPSETEWWNHGFSTENDFIYVTTQTLTEEQLLALSEDVGNNRTLLICCAAFRANEKILSEKLSNLTVKKIPNTIMSKCEWGRDDYSLNIGNLPQALITEEPKPTRKKVASKEADLFDIPAADNE